MYKKSLDISTISTLRRLVEWIVYGFSTRSRYMLTNLIVVYSCLVSPQNYTTLKMQVVSGIL